MKNIDRIRAMSAEELADNDEKINPCCEECINYEPLAIGINYKQFRDYCIEHQCHVNPKSNGCKYFSTKEMKERRAEQ